MKLKYILPIFGFALAVSSVLLSSQSVLPQSGNQSDVTGPNTLEISPDVRGIDLQGLPGASETARDIAKAEVDREAFDKKFARADFEQAVELFEQLQAKSFSKYFGVQLFGEIITAPDISESLNELSRQTGTRPGIVYVISLENQLELLFIPPGDLGSDEVKQEETIKYVRRTVPNVKRQLLSRVANKFREEVTNQRKTGTTGYLATAKQLYEWIIDPLESEFKAHKIDTLIFSLDGGLRSIPMAALNNGKEFLVEMYGVALIPSFSLVDLRYRPIINLQMLAFGISERTQGQNPLPAVSVEIPTLASNLWQGKAFLNQEATVNNLEFQSRQQRFGIIHVATHAEFKSGRIENSYIQFWNDKLRLDQLGQLSQKSEWNDEPKVELLVLSACRTALGNEQAELGFAGLAVRAGVKTAMGSLWYTSDEGSLALMSEFYNQLRSTTTKTEALRRAQLAMIAGNVKINGQQLRLSSQEVVSIPETFAINRQINLSHPYYWSAYTMVGNWN